MLVFIMRFIVVISIICHVGLFSIYLLVVSWAWRTEVCIYLNSFIYIVVMADMRVGGEKEARD